MFKLRLVSGARIMRIPAPAQGLIAETPKERYIHCLSEQASWAGKKACFRDYIGELSEDKNP